MFKEQGAFFGDSHLRAFVGKWRWSDAQQRWILSPGDPTQAEAEFPEFVRAIHTLFCRATARAKGSDEVSPVEVADYILERCQEEPFVFVMLMQLRFYSVIEMIRGAERSGAKGDAELYRVAIRYAQVLFALTHATSYVRIVAECLVGWECQSDADHKIYDEFLFTRQTANGKTIFADRFVEWIVKDIRFYLGKHAGQNQLERTERVASSLPERKKARVQANRAGDADVMSNRLPVTEVFLRTLVYGEEMNLAGPGHLKMGKRGEEEEMPEGAFKNPKVMFDLNPAVLRAFSIGLSRLRDYYRLYYLEGTPGQAKRSEKAGEGVSLSLLAMRLPGTARQLGELIQLKTSLDEDIIKSGYNVGEAKEEYLALNAQLPEDCKVVFERGEKKNKPAFVRKIIQARTKLMDLDACWEMDLVRALRAEALESNRGAAIGGKGMQAIVRGEIEAHCFYRLTAEAGGKWADKYASVGVEHMTPVSIEPFTLEDIYRSYNGPKVRIDFL